MTRVLNGYGFAGRRSPLATLINLFSSGEAGALYAPWVRSSLYEDSAGTTLASVDGPVGLILDGKEGYRRGSELLSDTSGIEWTGSNEVNRREIPSTSKPVTIEFDVTERTSGNLFVRLEDATNTTVSNTASFASSGLKRCTLIPTAEATKVAFVGTSTPIFTISDGISIRELPGNHATQSTADSRPVLRYAGGLYYLEFDGVDDFLDSPLLTWSPDFFISCGVAISGGEKFRGPWRFLTSGGSPNATDQNKLEEYSSSGNQRKAVLRRDPTQLSFYDDTPVRPSSGTTHVSWNSNEDGVEGRTGVLYSGAGALTDVSVGAKTLANGGDATLSLGRGFSGDIMSGREYGFVYLGRAPTDAEIDSANRAMMNRSGVTL